MVDKSFIDKVQQIQQDYVATKTEHNEFGGYQYRNIEKMLIPLKPLLKKHGLLITFTDTLEYFGDRYYVKATATLTDGTSSISASALAREELEKKKSDASQLTGSASTYARKYALSGLLGVDDGSNDPDSKDNDRKHYAPPKQASSAKPRFATMKQIELMVNKAKWGLGTYDKDEIVNWLYQVLGKSLTQITVGEVDDALQKIDKALREGKVASKVAETVPPENPDTVIKDIPDHVTLQDLPY